MRGSRCGCPIAAMSWPVGRYAWRAAALSSSRMNRWDGSILGDGGDRARRLWHRVRQYHRPGRYWSDAALRDFALCPLCARRPHDARRLCGALPQRGLTPATGHLRAEAWATVLRRAPAGRTGSVDGGDGGHRPADRPAALCTVAQPQLLTRHPGHGLPRDRFHLAQSDLYHLGAAVSFLLRGAAASLGAALRCPRASRPALYPGDDVRAGAAALSLPATHEIGQSHAGHGR